MKNRLIRNGIISTLALATIIALPIGVNAEWKNINNNWYYYDSTGNMLRNTWFYDAQYKKNYYFGNDGVMINSQDVSNMTNTIVTNYSDMVYTMKKENIKNKYDLNKYLSQKYSTLETPIGTLKFTFKVDENTDDFWGYDLNIETDYGDISNSPYGLYSFTPYDLEHSIKISNEDKAKTKELLKNLQRNIANDVMDVFPNKKISGGFYTSGYKYEYIRVGHWSIKFLSWRNYDEIDDDYFDYGDYSNTELTHFNWYAEDDDYDFSN